MDTIELNLWQRVHLEKIDLFFDFIKYSRIVTIVVHLHDKLRITKFGEILLSG